MSGNDSVAKTGARAGCRPSRTLVSILCAATILFGSGLWWGVTSRGGWGPDELHPGRIINAMDQGFANGWSHKYPPAHFYVLGAVFAPVLTGVHRGVFALEGRDLYALLLVLARTVSLVMAVGTIAIVFACGRRLYGERAGGFAAVFAMLLAPLAYYAKLANLDVPYLFWFALSLYFYLGILQNGRPRDYYAFAASAALAICTKDQAYGFYVLPVAVLAAGALRRSFGSQPADASRRAALPAVATLLVAGGVAAVVFAAIYQLPFNWAGALRHVRLITGKASEPFQMFEGTLAGHVEMGVQALWQLGWCLGWPALSLSVAGLVRELARGDRTSAAWLMLPPLSYYAFFISVVLYHYDRFFLGIAIVLALFAGKLASDWCEPGVARAGLKRAVVACALLVSLSQALVVDALMLSDSRYLVEDWLRHHVAPQQVVAAVGPATYLPRIEEFNGVYVRRLSQLERLKPTFVVLNRDHGARYQDGSTRARMYSHVRDSKDTFEMVFAVERGRLHYLLSILRVFPNRLAHALTNIDKVSPAIDVYRRSPR